MAKRSYTKKHSTRTAGQRFGRLTSVEFIDRLPPHYEERWRWHCDCGRDTVVPYNSVRKGNTKSCGCLKRETSVINGRKSLTTHGMSQLPEYDVWCAMLK